MFGTFCDIATDPRRRTRRQRRSSARRSPRSSQDPKPPASSPRPTCTPSARCATPGYYETYNRPNVSLVNVKENPISGMTPEGHRHRGRHRARTRRPRIRHRFRRGRRQLRSVDMRGRDGQHIKEHWSDGPDQLPRHDHQRIPQHVHDPRAQRPVHEPAAHDRGAGGVDRRHDPARRGHRDRPDRGQTRRGGRLDRDLRRDRRPRPCSARVDSWIFGANIPGKKRSVLFYLGGLGEYRKIVAAEAAAGYPSFVIKFPPLPLGAAHVRRPAAVHTATQH